MLIVVMFREGSGSEGMKGKEWEVLCVNLMYF